MTTGLRFRMLGTLEVLRDDAPLRLPSGLPRALLGLLLVHANEVVPVDRLQDELWQGKPPASAAHALQVYVLKLRKLLEVERSSREPAAVIITQSPGYLLAVPPDGCDASRFERLLADGSRAFDGGHPADAATLLAEGLSLWRGPVLGDLPDLPFVGVEAARLDELKAVAHERWVDAELALGHHGELVGALEGLVREHPFRERFWARLILALYRAGRQADAVQAYQRVRHLLAEELGLEPSPELRELESAVLRHDSRLAMPATSIPSPVAPAEEQERLPLPPRLLVDQPLPFIGREAEVAILERAWSRARHERAHVVLLAGEPGIGKTRLATEMALAAQADGGLVLFGTCDEDLAVPYQPFVEALHQAVEVCPDEELIRAVGARGGELSRLVPGLGRLLPDLSAPTGSDPETERYLLLTAAVELVERLAAWRPVLLFLDDLQWATKPTLLLLRHLVRAAPPGLLIIGSYRSSEVTTGHPLLELLAELHRGAAVARINLAGLSGDEALAMIETMAGHALEGRELELAQAVHAEADGSPFFMRELVRHFVDTGSLGGQGSVASGMAELGLPESVLEVIRHRLSRLPEETGRLLSLAAVVGHEFDTAVLAPLASMAPMAVIDALDVARHAALVREVKGSPGRYTFVHALIRDALYDDLGPARRLQLHQLTGETLESLGDTGPFLAQLAHHWLAAVPILAAPADHLRKAAFYADLAGQQAMSVAAYEEAVNHFEIALRAVRWGDDRHQVCRHLISLGEAQRCAGHPGHRETLLEAGSVALELGDVDAVTRAALANRRGFASFIGAVDAERVAGLEAALEAIGSADTSVRARLLASLAAEVHFEGPRHLELARQAVEIARRAGDDATLAQSLVELWFATWGSESNSERVRIAAELEAAAAPLTDRSLQFQARVCRFLAATAGGDMTRADESLAGCRRLAEELGQPVLRWRTAWLEAHRLMAVGRLDDAERSAREAFSLGEATGQPDRLTYLSTPLTVVRLMQGRPGDVPELLKAVIEEFPGVIGYRGLLAWALAEDGELGGARSIVKGLQPDGFAGVPRDYIWLLSISTLGRACARLDDAAVAAEIYELLLPHQEEITTLQTSWLGPVTHDLGMLATVLGRFSDAEGHFALAVALQDRIGAHAAVIHTRLEWARMLRRRGASGDADQARALLGEAQAGADGLGLPMLSATAAQLLQS